MNKGLCLYLKRKFSKRDQNNRSEILLFLLFLLKYVYSASQQCLFLDLHMVKSELSRAGLEIKYNN